MKHKDKQQQVEEMIKKAQLSFKKFKSKIETKKTETDRDKKC